jgi:hypothetical protein
MLPNGIKNEKITVNKIVIKNDLLWMISSLIFSFLPSLILYENRYTLSRLKNNWKTTIHSIYTILDIFGVCYLTISKVGIKAKVNTAIDASLSL